MSLRNRIRKLEEWGTPQGPPVQRIVVFEQGETEEEKGRILAEKRAEILAAGESLYSGRGPSILILDLAALEEPQPYSGL